jgi:hypothetical protein
MAILKLVGDDTVFDTEQRNKRRKSAKTRAADPELICCWIRNINLDLYLDVEISHSV